MNLAKSNARASLAVYVRTRRAQWRQIWLYHRHSYLNSRWAENVSLACCCIEILVCFVVCLRCAWLCSCLHYVLRSSSRWAKRKFLIMWSLKGSSEYNLSVSVLVTKKNPQCVMLRSEKQNQADRTLACSKNMNRGPDRHFSFVWTLEFHFCLNLLCV